MLGEAGLYGPDPNATSVTAGSEVSLYVLSRADFEARLGPLQALMARVRVRVRVS